MTVLQKEEVCHTFQDIIYTPASWDHSEYVSEVLLPIIAPLMLDKKDACLETEKTEGLLRNPGRGVDNCLDDNCLDAFPLNRFTGTSTLELSLVKENGSVSLLNGKAAMV